MGLFWDLYISNCTPFEPRTCQTLKYWNAKFLAHVVAPARSAIPVRLELGGAISRDTGGAGIRVDGCARGDPLGEGCYKYQRLEYLMSKSIV